MCDEFLSVMEAAVLTSPPEAGAVDGEPPQRVGEREERSPVLLAGKELMAATVA
jgi:hypothetical protein